MISQPTPGGRIFNQPTGTLTSNVSLVSEFQKHLSTAELKRGVVYQGKFKNGQVNESGQKGDIMFRMMLMSRIKMLKCFVIQTSFYKLTFCGPHKIPHGIRGLIKH